MVKKLYFLIAIVLCMGCVNVNASQLAEAIKHNSLEKVERLLLSGANANELLAGDLPILRFACTVGNPDIVNELLAYGANPNAQWGTHNNAVLHMIAKTWLLTSNDLAIAQFLLDDPRTDVTILNDQNQTALALAKEERDLDASLAAKMPKEPRFSRAAKNAEQLVKMIEQRIAKDIAAKGH